MELVEKEYKVKVKARKHNGFLPDFFGMSVNLYVSAHSAEEAEKIVQDHLNKEFGLEIEMGEVSFSLDVNRV